MSNLKLDLVSNFTYLGIKLDKNFIMNDHDSHLYNSALTIVYTLRTVRNFIDSKTALIIFKSHILSRLEYGSQHCIGTNSNHLDKLQKLVNQSLRICMKESRYANV